MRNRQVRRHYDGIRVAQAAHHLVGRTSLSVGDRSFRNDCSGFVDAAYHTAGYILEGRNSAAMFELAKDSNVYHRRRRPLPGDVAFFDNTWDRNQNGRIDDRLTHVAVVEKVDENGTITLVHNGSRGVKRLYMNLYDRHETRSAAGDVINSYLRHRTNHDRRRTRYLSAELWRGFASLWKLDDAK